MGLTPSELTVLGLLPIHPPVLVGLANQPMIPPDRLHDALDSRAKAVAEKVDEVRRAADAQPDAPRFVHAIFDFSLRMLQTESKWLADYRAELRKASGATGETQ